MNGDIATISLQSGHAIDIELTIHYCQKCALNYQFKAIN